MLKKIFLLFILTLVISGSLQAQVTFIVDLSPAAQTTEPLFLAHNFNRWQAGDTNYQFQNGILQCSLSRCNLEYKICGQSWDVAEANADGTGRRNRKGYYDDGDTLYLKVLAWEHHGDQPPKGVFPLHGSQALHYQGLKRKIWIYLPPDYQKSTKSYPVLYLHDGQNLFEGLEGSPDKWKIAGSLDSLKLDLIVVGINHGGTKRIEELSPFPQEKYGGGEGDVYLDYVVGTVKNWVDKHYRSKPDRAHTYIGGSSLGGLISMYALLKYPDTFGGALIFSPAYWFNPQVLEMARNFPPKKRTFVYQVVGDQEGTMPEEFMRDLRTSKSILNEHPQVWQHHSEIITGRKHNEAFWRREFPKALNWFKAQGLLKDRKK